MNPTPVNPTPVRNKRTRTLAVMATFGLLLAICAYAQDFAAHRGNPNRTGTPTLSVSTPGGTPVNVYNDSGRAFLRWWDPIRRSQSTVDNDQNDAVGSTNAAGPWAAPGLTAGSVARNYYQQNTTLPPYRYVTTVLGTDSDDPTQGATATYSWTMNNLVTAAEYEVYVSIPIGDTDVDPGPGLTRRFGQRYYVFRVTGLQGGAVATFVVDSFAFPGSFVRLGGQDTVPRTFAPAGTTLTVTLFNTTPINNLGQPIDPGARPGEELVYADAVRQQNFVTGSAAPIPASPIVGELRNANPNGSPATFRTRAFMGRNEVTGVGTLNRTYSLASLGAYTYNGVQASGNVDRRNLIFSWPVRRPGDTTSTEATRYAREKRDWIIGPDPNNAETSRRDQRVVMDDLNGGSTFSGVFLQQPGGANSFGTTYLEAPAVVGSPTAQANFTPRLPDGRYFLEVWLPRVQDPTLATAATLEVYQGGTLVDTLTVDFSSDNGWLRVPFQPATGYASTQAQGLRVVLTNQSGVASDAGKLVLADAVRFVRQADLSMTSTPVLASVAINQPGFGVVQRDVVVAALESGRLYCIDAHGDEATGAAPNVYWTYPTEGATDPNSVNTEDGQDNINEDPVGFDLSSALVANVGGQDLLYVAAANGKVYCIEMTGRGDGSTRRRWTYPDDFDPTNPALPMQAGLRPIRGSVALADAAGTPVILVPTQEGRILALNAAGDPVTKRTSVVWQYPPAIGTPLGPITTTPVAAFGKVFFVAPLDQLSAQGGVFALDAATGNLLWQQNTTPAGNFANFAASPMAVPGIELQDTLNFNLPAIGSVAGVSAVFVGDSAGLFASINEANGAVLWTTNESAVGFVGGPTFTYTVSFDNTQNLTQDVPTVVIPGANGRLFGFHAAGNRNRNFRSAVWGFQLEGDQQRGGVAAGGWRPGDVRSWLYAGDSEGFVYAFNSVSDTVVNPITPGDPPGQSIDTDNDPGFDELNNIIDADNFVIISEAAFNTLREKADDPGNPPTEAEIQTLATTENIERRHFEFGETLYVLIYGMPDLSSNPNLAGYYIEFELSGSGNTTQRRQVPVRAPLGNNSRYCLTSIALLPLGAGSLTPGKAKLTARAIAPGQRGSQGPAVSLQKPPSFPVDPTWDIYTANPLAIRTLTVTNTTRNSVGWNNGGGDGSGWQFITDDTNLLFPIYFANGNSRTDQTQTDFEPSALIGPELQAMGDDVSHGTNGVSRFAIVDRSLMVLVLNRGLNKVRVGPRDIAWVRDGSATGGVYKPLTANAGVSYPGFEDYPVFLPNTSLDYPDVNRDGLSVAKQVFGGSENALFVNGVELQAPIIDPNARATYSTKAGFDNQLTRQLVPTNFDVSLAVPRFQPPSRAGYYGSQLVYVDSLQPGEQDLSGESFRTTGLILDVGIDERMATLSPTVDVGSLPAGGGYHGGPSFGPANPWDPASAFAPWNTVDFGNLFQPFVVVNEGNVNLLNVRMAKYYRDNFGARPVELYSPGLHELAWIDSLYHLHTSVDPRYAASGRVPGGTPGADPFARAILQKARPGDVTSTRLNVNPRSRPNAGLRTPGGLLFDPNVIVPGDPKLAVTAPIGMPVGSYLTDIFVIEDSDTANNVSTEGTTLGTNEASIDPGIKLKFTVRETRVTNRPTAKSAPVMENVLAGTDTFGWTNTQPSGMRDGAGNVYVAFSSNRLDAGSVPGWAPRQKLEGDSANQDAWRIYIGSVTGGGNTAPLTESPQAEFNGWVPNTAQRWFRQAAGPLPIEPPDTLFDVNAGNGQSLDPASVRFGHPAFPSSGAFDQTEFPDGAGRTALSESFVAFLGEAVRRDNTGDTEVLNQIMLVPLTLGADGTLVPGQTQAVPFDATARKSRPSLIVSGQTATVFYTSSTGTLGQINWSSFNQGGGWFGPGSLRLGSAFESIGAPSAVLRRYRNSNERRVELTFTGKVRGRNHAEVYLARMQASPQGVPSFRRPVVNFPNTDYELTVDPSTGIYWSQGLQWTVSPDDVDPNQPNRCITVRRLVNGVWQTIWDGNAATYLFDQASGILSFTTNLGGKAYVDTTTGSVRLVGVVATRDMRFAVRVRPTLLRVSTAADANYRSVSAIFDDRFIGINVFPNNPQRNLLGDFAYWGNEINLAPNVDDLLRFDRLVVAYSRTSSDGTAVARPYYQSLRPGVRLPGAVALNPNGSPVLFEVTWLDGSPASERFYQIDPATGRVFFMAGHEDRRVRIRFAALDSSGASLGTLTIEDTVRLVTEFEEQAVPIEQAANESGVNLALDPLNGPFNSQTVRRAGLVWMFWSSSRGGGPDVYLQTIAPRFTPRPPSR